MRCTDIRLCSLDFTMKNTKIKRTDKSALYKPLKHHTRVKRSHRLLS
ncbi:hypothetical protein [Moraxella lacunata]